MCVVAAAVGAAAAASAMLRRIAASDRESSALVRLVEAENGRAPRERARDAEVLLLAAAQLRRRDERLKLGRQRLNEGQRVGDRGCGRHGGRVGAAARRDVVVHREWQQLRLLRNDGKLRAKPRERHIAHVDAADGHAPGVHVVEPREERDDGRLSAAGGADERDARARLDDEVEAREDRLCGPRGVREADDLEGDAERRRGERDGGAMTAWRRAAAAGATATAPRLGTTMPSEKAPPTMAKRTCTTEPPEKHANEALPAMLP